MPKPQNMGNGWRCVLSEPVSEFTPRPASCEGLCWHFLRRGRCPADMQGGQDNKHMAQAVKNKFCHAGQHRTFTRNASRNNSTYSRDKHPCKLPVFLVQPASPMEWQGVPMGKPSHGTGCQAEQGQYPCRMLRQSLKALFYESRRGRQAATAGWKPEAQCPSFMPGNSLPLWQSRLLKQ